MISSPASGDYAGAYLESGLGTRGAGMGDAFSAAVDDESAIYWNAARLTRIHGLNASASLHRLSLDRRRNSLAAAFNRRGGLAFGLAWIHASVGDLKARTGAGDPFGDIDDSENAFFFALGIPLGKKLSAGGGREDPPASNRGAANGRLDRYGKGARSSPALFPFDKNSTCSRPEGTRLQVAVDGAASLRAEESKHR